MPFGTALNAKVAVNTESAWGVPLTTGAKYLRVTGADLKTTQQFISSNEINPTHRETADVRAVSALGGGTMNFEPTYQTWEDVLASLFGAAWTGTTTRTLKPGKTLRSMTVQEEMTDITQMISYPGAVFTSWSLNVQQGQMVTSSVTFASKRGVPAATSAIGTPAAPNTNDVWDPIGSVQVLTEGGSSIVGASTFSLQVTSDLIQIPNLLTADPAALYQGRFAVTGSLSVHKQDAALATKYLNREKTILAITLGGATTKRLALTMAKTTFTDESRPWSGSNAIMETFPFVATFDATDSSLKLVASD
jgi:hypothetical protein